MLTQPNLDIPTLFSRIVVLMIAFAIHEFAHAWTADHFGDNTPRSQGRVTLNPMAHLDPLGSLMLLIFGFGWARPVPVDPFKLGGRNFMLTALAGPMSNLVMALAASSLVWVGLIPLVTTAPGAILPTAFSFLSEFVWINLLLMLFNLIPLFPLDGEKVLGYFLPPAGQDIMATLRPYGTMLLMVVIFIFPSVFGALIGRPLSQLYDLMFLDPAYKQYLQGAIQLLAG